MPSNYFLTARHKKVFSLIQLKHFFGPGGLPIPAFHLDVSSSQPVDFIESYEIDFLMLILLKTAVSLTGTKYVPFFLLVKNMSALFTVV